MKVFKIILILVLIPVIYICGQLLFGTLTDYKPADKIRLRSSGELQRAIEKDSLEFYIWNIGYAGLGKESDFFMDGGQSTRMSADITTKNLDGIKQTIGQWKDADFVLLQEVDEVAKRSYKVNQFDEIDAVLGTDWKGSLAYNYVVKYVPVPLFKPYGKVRAGLATYAPYQPDSIDRYQFPGNFDWPKRIYFLDRCFLVSRFPYKDSELLVINTHNSAYDDGTLKKNQMQFLKDFILEEYLNGKYVIVGGDWNQCPPGYDCYSDFEIDKIEYQQSNIAEDFMPEDWNWSYDNAVKTNRKLSAPYIPGTTFATVIDFYLTSPNITVLNIEGVDLDFEYSDHQPVKLQIRLD